MRVRDLLAEGRARLATQEVGGLEAEVLLMHILGVNRAWLYANGDETAARPDSDAFMELVRRRAGGEPVAHLVGVREFWSLNLRVVPGVLIPRPETELLVETALEFIPSNQACRVVDLGTGSGAVAIALALERPACEVHATEISPEALDVARQNVRALAPERVTLHEGCWLHPLHGRFGVIVSNPPYIDADDPHLRQGDLRFEPRSALSPGPDGLAAIRRIVADAMDYLEDGGLLAFEHGHEHGGVARALLLDGGYASIETRKDLEGRDRVTLGLRPG